MYLTTVYSVDNNNRLVEKTYEPANIAEVKAWVQNAIELNLEFSVRHYSTMHAPLPYRVIAHAWRSALGTYKADADWDLYA